MSVAAFWHSVKTTGKEIKVGYAARIWPIAASTTIRWYNPHQYSHMGVRFAVAALCFPFSAMIVRISATSENKHSGPP